MKANSTLALTPLILMAIAIATPCNAAGYVSGKSDTAYEVEKLVASQQETINLLRSQIDELKKANALRQEEIEELKKANALKQEELDSHKYDRYWTFIYIIVTAIVTAIATKLVDHWSARRKRQ